MTLRLWATAQVPTAVAGLSEAAVSGGGTRGVVFVVSGEITDYHGSNYLLLRKVLVRRDMGNFR